MKMRYRQENGGRRSVATFRKTGWLATIIAFAAFAATAGRGVQTASADETTDGKDWRPVAVVASVGYDAAWAAAERVAQEMKFVEAVEAARAIYGDVQGVDREKPFGLVVATDGSEVVPFAFLPVANVEKLEFVGASDLKEKIETTAEGTFFGDEPRLRLLEKDGWLFICEAGKENAVPTTEPSLWLDCDGALSFQVELTALPEELLEAGFAALRQKAAENAPTDDEAALEQFDATLEYYSAIFDSLERVSWTLNVDAATGDVVCDCAVVCKDGSPLSETFAGAQNAETRWGAIAETPNAVFAAVQAGKRSAFEREFLAKQQAVAFDNLRNALEIGLDSDEERALAEELFAVVEKFAKSTGADGTFDAASAFACDASSVWFSTAFAPVDGSELTVVARKIFDNLKKDEAENAEKIAKFVKLDAETVEGFVVSKLDVPFAELDADLPEPLAARWSDKTFAVRWGTSGDAILVVAGIDSSDVDAEFARIAAASQTKTPVPRRVEFAVAPLGTWLLGVVAENDGTPVVARKTLERIAEADDARLAVEYKIDGNRLDAQYVVKSGVFRLIGDVARIALAAKFGSGDEGEDVDYLFEEE
ncbi:MAG: hypothetical protein IJO40_12335 [Thermoguttaceae bacterium]|nr:hypothetical protein [Thermoguttaceae bacterium]